MTEGELLAGGIGNAGAVVRIGDAVLRPAGPHHRAIHALLAHVRAAGFTGTPEVLGLEPDGRERLRFIPGAVAIPPFPAWADDEGLLVSAAGLLRSFHDAQAGFVAPPGATWDGEMADPTPGPDPVICHTDPCLENLVVRDGVAVALLDLEFAAPGRRVWDVAALARYLGPMDPPEVVARAGRRPDLDPVRRLRLVVDAYGVEGEERAAVVDALGTQMEQGAAFVRRRVAAGEPAFVAMWETIGGEDRYSARAAWFAARRDALVAGLA